MTIAKEQDPIVHEDLANSISYLKSDLKKLEGKTIVVTGAAGFVCSYFVDLVAMANELLLKEPCRIIAIDNFIRDVNNISHLAKDPNVSVKRHDITKPLELERADFIVHGASIASPTFYRQFPLETMEVNVTGTRNMLELARKTKCQGFLFMSTSEVYGDPPAHEIPTKETYRGNVSSTGPRACYDESKRFGETLCVVYGQQFGIPVKITRLFNIYGPRLSLQDKRVIPDFIRDALGKKPITLLSDGKATRTFCYISDAVDAHFKILLSNISGEVFNVGNPASGEISMKDLAEKIARIAGSRAEISFGKSEDTHYLTDNPQRRCPDTAKVEKMLGWRARAGLDEGLGRTIGWHRARRGVMPVKD